MLPTLKREIFLDSAQFHPSNQGEKVGNPDENLLRNDLNLKV